MVRLTWIYIATMAMAVLPVMPCTYEIPSLRNAVNGAALVVVGTVESVVGDSSSPWYPEPVVFPQSMTFAVEEVLKGVAPSDRLVLLFSDDIVRSSCGLPYLAYLPGSRFVLLLDQPTAPATYRAPGIDPWRMRLSAAEDYTSTPLYLYLTRIVRDGVQPIRVAFEAQSTQLVNYPLTAKVIITNELNSSLQVWLGRPQYGHVGLGLWLSVEGVSPSSYETPADEIGIVQIAPMSAATVNLGGIFTVIEPGKHGIRGYLWVPNGAPVLEYPPEAADFYDILHGTEASLWSYHAEVETGLTSDTWGEVKAEAHQSYR